MYHVLVVQVLDGPQQRPNQVTRFLLVVERLGDDAVEQLASCVGEICWACQGSQAVATFVVVLARKL